MKKNTKQYCILECTEAKKLDKPASRYITSKPKLFKGKLEKMKYNKFIRKHTLHREIKK